jgi:hypothetical protein
MGSMTTCVTDYNGLESSGTSVALVRMLWSIFVVFFSSSPVLFEIFMCAPHTLRCCSLLAFIASADLTLIFFFAGRNEDLGPGICQKHIKGAEKRLLCLSPSSSPHYPWILIKHLTHEAANFDIFFTKIHHYQSLSQTTHVSPQNVQRFRPLIAHSSLKQRHDECDHLVKRRSTWFLRFLWHSWSETNT